METSGTISKITKKNYKTSLSKSMINKKNEMRKHKSNTPQLNKSQTDQKQINH